MRHYITLIIIVLSSLPVFAQKQSLNVKEKYVASVDAFFKSIETNNFNAMEELFSADFSVTFPYSEGIIPNTVMQRDSAIAFFKSGADFFRKIQFTLHTRHVDSDNRVVIYTWTADNAFKDGVREYHNQYTGFFYFD